MLDLTAGGWQWWEVQNLVRNGWKTVFGIPDSENVSPAGEDSDWVKEIHCCVNRMEVYFSLVL